MKHSTIGKCRACNQDIIWMVTKNFKNIPVDIESVDVMELHDLTSDEKMQYRHGDHVSHFNTCAKRDRPRF